jgi:tRNA (guanine-N7-)-methyltransferase
MSKGKLQKFAEVATFPNVFQSPKARKAELRNHLGEGVEMKGKWHAHFGNVNPIVLELACGRGEYTVALGRRNPNKNFIGVDVKGARIWKGAKQALVDGLSNVAFVRVQIDHLPEVFAPNEIDEIWITFPDPFIKKSKWRKRLTSAPFLNTYKQFLKPGGPIHLKTDSDLLFEFTLEMINEGRHHIIDRIDDVWAMSPVPEDLQTKTYYEQMHLEEGRTIKYLRFQL